MSASPWSRQCPGCGKSGIDHCPRCTPPPSERAIILAEGAYFSSMSGEIGPLDLTDVNWPALRIALQAAIDAYNDRAVSAAAEHRSMVERLISPNGFDGLGPTPGAVTDAARRTAQLRVIYLTGRRELTHDEVDDLFSMSAISAEWTRELYEARDRLAEKLLRALDRDPS